jgi:CYTH domain-containing protein
MEQNFRPLVSENNKLKPLKQLYSGYEIEKKWVLATKEEDHTKNKNALERYNEVLESGTKISQGYIKDFDKARQLIEELGISLSPEFKPNTVRLRDYGGQYILTFKDKKETKTRELEFELERKTFKKWWPETKGSRVEKKRLRKKIKGFMVEFDAFTDRFLLLAEIEVTKEEDLKKCPALGMDVTNQSNWSNKALSK